MDLPKYQAFCKPILLFLQDGKAHSTKEIKQYTQKYFSLKEEDIIEKLASGGQTVFTDRNAWALLYLKNAILIENTSRGIYQITQRGLDVLKDAPDVLNNQYLKRFPEFQQFLGKNVDSEQQSDTDENTPEDTFAEAFEKMNDNLADEILDEVMRISPVAFEKMILDLLAKMGYGAFENAGRTTSITGDEGIDGIIMEDKLGFDLIYIQAKKWDRDKTVGRPEIQSFVGAIAGKGGKGLFVTTAKFSSHAIAYVQTQHIILIDGRKLANLMMEYNFGVTVKKTFAIKAIDTDVFNEYNDEN